VEAREALAKLSASGESVAAFSRRTGVSGSRIAYWRRRLAGSGAATDFVAVDLAELAPLRCHEIIAGGVVVRVREDLEADEVARLVAAIGRHVSGAC
jgi:hypothetical protein